MARNREGVGIANNRKSRFVKNGSLQGLDLLEHCVNARSRRIVSASRIVGALRHTFNLDDTIHQVEREALATKVPEIIQWPGVGHRHACDKVQLVVSATFSRVSQLFFSFLLT